MRICKPLALAIVTAISGQAFAASKMEASIIRSGRASSDRVIRSKPHKQAERAMY